MQRAAGGGALWRLRGALRPHRRALALNAGLAAASMLAGILLPLLARRLLDDHALRGDTDGLPLIAALTVLCAGGEAVLIALRRVTGPATALAVEETMRHRLVGRVLSQPAAFHDRHTPAVLATRIVSDLALLRRFVSFGLPFLIINSLTVVVVVVLLLWLCWPLGLLVVAATVPPAVLARRWEHSSREVTRQVQRDGETFADLLDESIQGVDTIQAFGRRDDFTARLEKAADRLRRSQRERARLWTALSTLVEGCPSAVLVTLIGAGVAAVWAGAVTVGTLVAVLTLWLFLLWPVQSLGGLMNQLQQADAAAERVSELLHRPPVPAPPPAFRPAPPPSSRPAPPSSGPARVGSRGAELVLDQVWFRYPPAGPDPPTGPAVLTGMDLRVAAGERVTVVGAAGSGKSTLAALLTGLYEPSGGRILIDGTDLRHLPTARRADVVAPVPEHPGLFAGTIRDNVRLGRPEADDAEVTEALRAAQAFFVHELRHGLDEPLTEAGLSLSGGQRRRLALARAFLCRPRLLVLDDPLVGLDPRTAQQVGAAVSERLGDTTVLWLTRHRPPAASPGRVVRLHSGHIDGGSR
ncbi:ABC transporter ATP-binding protein [Plantactinospora sp. S1510]|uniref:ABC transporter ATP-binding protein n=1 Tax=Plantactinospora alkalitolerans TaxID=2789879 RepID=A0ABS0GVT2_9ACTN|nr:ABC transporter ATP-binding protein [Plantactinospora alkalitolerans]MBF9130305.1 ABC transporter ATP-binding protein [Plantactinospora alkalitolerans]